MPDIELVVTDLDGTLWPGGSERPHASTLAAWSELDRRGIPVLVASGRRMARVRSSLAALGRAPCAVALNGAIGVDLARDDCFHRHSHAPDRAVAVLAAFRAQGLDPCVYVEHPEIDVYVGDSPSTSALHLATFGDRVRRADLDEIVAKVPVLNFSVFGHDAATLGVLATAIGGDAAPRVIASPFGIEHGIDVAAAGLSKWSGVLAYCDRYDVDPSRVLAIGDEVNDIELIANAAIGVAMADAPGEVLDAADHMVAPAADGGWAEILDLV